MPVDYGAFDTVGQLQSRSEHFDDGILVTNVGQIPVVTPRDDRHRRSSDDQKWS